MHHRLAGLGARTGSVRSQGLAHVLVAVQRLAEGVANGTEQLSGTTREALVGILEEMEAIVEAAEEGHGADQGLVDDARDAVRLQCDASDDGEVNVSAAKANSSEHEHAQCRRAEAKLNRNASAKCTTYWDVVATPSPPECMPTLSGAANKSEAELLESCLADISAWVGPYQARAVKTRADCKNATDTHQERVQQCGGLQRVFERRYCDYRKEVKSTCSRYTNCFARLQADQQTLHERIQLSEASRKAQYVAAKHIQCFIMVINASSAERRNLLENYSSLEVATSHLDVTYHDALEAEECDDSAVALHACEEQWLAKRYTSQPWFDEAPTAECSPCEDDVSTTAALTEPATTTEVTSTVTATTSTTTATSPATCTATDVATATTVRITSCTASSEYSGSYSCEKAYDGLATDWASLWEGVGSWIQLNFENTEAIGIMEYTNRAWRGEANKRLRLTFSDGSTQEVGDVADIEPSVLSFTPVSTSFVRIEVLEVYGTYNNGAKEIRFFHCQAASVP